MLRYQGEFFEIYGKKIKQVNKIAAKKAYERGETVYFLACNMHPNGRWQRPAPFNRNEMVFDNVAFESCVSEYRYYNCDNERGKYPIFFVELNN